MPFTRPHASNFPPHNMSWAKLIVRKTIFNSRIGRSRSSSLNTAPLSAPPAQLPASRTRAHRPEVLLNSAKRLLWGDLPIASTDLSQNGLTTTQFATHSHFAGSSSTPSQ